jgi:hypothetical protein
VGRPKATGLAGRWIDTGERGGGPAGLKGRMGWLAAGPIGPKAKENSFPNKDLIFEYTKAFEGPEKATRGG